MNIATSPTVRLAVDSIRGQIRSGNYRQGSYLPPETELAAELGISRGTVRRAIEVLVESGEIVRRPYSRPTIESRTVPAHATGSEVHVWVSHPIAGGVSLQFLKGISEGLMGTSYRMVVREPSRFHPDTVRDEEREFLTNLSTDDEAVGAIIERDAGRDNDDLYARLLDQGKHLVFVDIPAPEGLTADYVGTANSISARECVSHLLDMGHSRILFVTDTDLPPTIKERIKGYWRGIRQAGLENSGQVLVVRDLEPEDVGRMPVAGPFARNLGKTTAYAERAQKAAKAILAMDPLPTAIFVGFDALAFWLCACLEGAGLRIPQDISVIGFDWIARWDDPSTDLLSSAAQDFEGFGINAADLLLDRVADGFRGGPRHVLLPAPLVARMSTGSTPGLSPGETPSFFPENRSRLSR